LERIFLKGVASMKKIIICLLFFSFFLIISSEAKQVYVGGYYRKDGTYVRPHYRSSPDTYLWNNYGRPSYQQRKEWESYPVVLSYMNYYDNDGIWNQYDLDDDNDGLFDDFDKNPYGDDTNYDSDDYYNGEYNNNYED